MGLCGQLTDRLLTDAAKKSKPFQVIGVLQEGFEKCFGEIYDVAIRFPFKMPAMDLSGDHEIDLEKLYFKPGKVYLMRSRSFCKKDYMIKRMPVREVKLLIMSIEVGGEPFYQVIGALLFIKAADVINRYFLLCHGFPPCIAQK
jgi:hypothetical protein